MIIRIFYIALSLVLCCYSLAWTKETIKVGAVFAQTGTATFNNSLTLQGVRYAVEDINMEGGVLGKPLELLEFDNQSTSLGSRTAARKAVEAGSVAVLGAVWSSHSLAMAPILQEAGIPMLTPISTNPMVTRAGNYIFRLCYTDPFQGEILARFAFEHLRARTAGVLVNVDSRYSEGLAGYFISSFEKLGGKIVFTEHHLEKTVDFSRFISKVKEEHPEVIFNPGHTRMSAFVIKQARLNGITTTFLGGDGWQNTMYSLAGKLIEGNYYTSHWHPHQPTEISKQFVERYQLRSRTSTPSSALGEDSVRLLVDAIRRANSTSPEKIRDALARTTNFSGITGKITFNENGDPIKPAVILQFKDGQSVFVKSVTPSPSSYSKTIPEEEQP